MTRTGIRQPTGCCGPSGACSASPGQNDPTVEFHLGHGAWIRLLRANGFDVEDLIELWPPIGADSDANFVTTEWPERWPCEELWRARRR